MADAPTQDAVLIEREGDVALVAFNNPPVNAASHALRTALSQAIETLDADPAVKAIALYGGGKTFIAGADIREFGKPPREPILPAVCTQIETAQTPVVAAIHGNCLGGGLEVALACHARIALPGTTVGFPEVTLGIFPGAGGTQRAPRVAGIKATVDLATTGKRIDAHEAVTLGLIDEIAEGEPRAVALKAGEDAISGALPLRRTRDMAVTPDDAAIEATKAALKRKAPHLISPVLCCDAIAASVKPMDEGLAVERELFSQALDSPQRAGLVHAFFAERAVARIPEKSATPREVKTVGVIGAGTMGSGIATSALMAGLTVRLNERNDEALGKGRATIENNLEGAVKRGKMTAEARDKALGENFHPSTELERFADADLVIEAVFEEMDVKKPIFKRLDGIAKDGAILASNTSYLDINEIAAETSRPQDVIGLHFFSPAHVMRLLEVVVGDKTAPEVVATGFQLARRMNKVAVRAGVCDGFIGNRILTHYKKCAEYMMLDGASPYQIDKALEEFGFAMGPFAVADLAGLDIGWAARKRQSKTRSNRERYVTIADRICENGWYGRKTGSGYYVYGGDKPEPNPDVQPIIDNARAEAGITPREFTDEEIVSRYMTAMISECARVVDEGIALRPIDVDAVYLFGYGFPRFRGGPMHYADTIGAAELVRRIETYAADDDYYWQVPDILRRMAQDGTTFADKNEER